MAVYYNSVVLHKMKWWGNMFVSQAIEMRDLGNSHQKILGRLFKNPDKPNSKSHLKHLNFPEGLDWGRVHSQEKKVYCEGELGL